MPAQRLHTFLRPPPPLAAGLRLRTSRHAPPPRRVAGQPPARAARRSPLRHSSPKQAAPPPSPGVRPSGRARRARARPCLSRVSAGVSDSGPARTTARHKARSRYACGRAGLGCGAALSRALARASGVRYQRFCLRVARVSLDDLSLYESAFGTGTKPAGSRQRFAQRVPVCWR